MRCTTKGSEQRALSDVAMSAGAVSFTHIVKASEPVVSAALSALARVVFWPAMSALFTGVVSAGLFDGVALVAHEGGVVWQGGVGLADRDTGVPNAADLRVPIASLTRSMSVVPASAYATTNGGLAR